MIATGDEFSDPAPSGPEVDRNGVERAKDGRPRIGVRCADLCDGGRVPGKRAGTTKKCPRCDGLTGFKRVLYTRCTSFVGALEDRANLEAWQKRVVLLGLAADHKASCEDDDARDRADDANDPWAPLAAMSLVERLARTDPEDREALDALAEEAYEKGDGYRKAQKGTDLHDLTERHDRGEPLGDLTLEDRRDLAAWCRIVEEYGMEMLGIECFVVEDGFGIGGTYDRRVYSPDPRLACEVCDEPGEEPFRPKVVDLKSGRIDYGAGKMCQQLAVYANARDYDAETFERTAQNVCPHLGFIVHLPQGTGTASLHRLDLVAGWSAVALSAAVRQHRSASKKWLTPVEPSSLAFEVAP